jgi:hypothetical protein
MFSASSALLEHALLDAFVALLAGLARAVLERGGDAGPVQQLLGVGRVPLVVRVDRLEPVEIAGVGVEPLALGLQKRRCGPRFPAAPWRQTDLPAFPLLLAVGELAGPGDDGQDIGHVVRLVGVA